MWETCGETVSVSKRGWNSPLRMRANGRFFRAIKALDEHLDAEPLYGALAFSGLWIRATHNGFACNEF